MTAIINGIVVVDANILIAICANEPKRITAEKSLEEYAKNNWEFCAPNIIVAEVLYVLCQKHFNGTLTDSDYEKSLENFQDQLLASERIIPMSFSLTGQLKFKRVMAAVIQPTVFILHWLKVCRNSFRRLKFLLSIVE